MTHSEYSLEFLVFLAWGIDKKVVEIVSGGLAYRDVWKRFIALLLFSQKTADCLGLFMRLSGSGFGKSCAEERCNID